MNKIKESKALEEIYKIREEYYEETKHLSSKELIEKIRRDGEEVIKKYGLKLPTLEKTRR